MTDEDWQERAIRAEQSQSFRIFLGIAPYAFALLVMPFIPFVKEFTFPFGILAGLAVAISYLWTSQLIALLFIGRSDTAGAVMLQWFAWGWFYYWAVWRGLLLPVYIGPLLIVGVFGRLAIFWGWMKDAKAGRLPR